MRFGLMAANARNIFAMTLLGAIFGGYAAVSAVHGDTGGAWIAIACTVIVGIRVVMMVVIVSHSTSRQDETAPRPSDDTDRG